jgi:hypothetical protein
LLYLFEMKMEFILEWKRLTPRPPLPPPLAVDKTPQES